MVGCCVGSFVSGERVIGLDEGARLRLVGVAVSCVNNNNKTGESVEATGEGDGSGVTRSAIIGAGVIISSIAIDPGSSVAGLSHRTFLKHDSPSGQGELLHISSTKQSCIR